MDAALAVEVSKLMARNAKAEKIIAAIYDKLGPNVDPASAIDLVASCSLAEWNDFAIEIGLPGASAATIAVVLWQLTERQLASR